MESNTGTPTSKRKKSIRRIELREGLKTPQWIRWPDCCW